MEPHQPKSGNDVTGFELEMRFSYFSVKRDGGRGYPISYEFGLKKFHSSFDQGIFILQLITTGNRSFEFLI